MEEKIKLPDFPGRISIGLQEGFCNLHCPKCPVHGEGGGNLIKGKMNLQKACNLLDQLKNTEVVLASEGYTEPLIQENFWEYLKEVKNRQIKMNINTNGLLMSEDYAQRLIDLKIDCVFVSIDAVTKDTLKKVRGTDNLEKINAAVFNLLKARGDKSYPRIGVSFLVQKENAHEKEEFISYWIQHVDAVRVAQLYLEGEFNYNLIPGGRKPCSVLYDTMLIHHNGDVPLCCWDGSGRTKVGNVFEQGIKSVWLGEPLQKARLYHETGQFDKVPLCKGCNDWIRYAFTTEEAADGILIQRSPLLVYYNRIDRLKTWKFGAGKNLEITNVI